MQPHGLPYLYMAGYMVIQLVAMTTQNLVIWTRFSAVILLKSLSIVFQMTSVIHTFYVYARPEYWTCVLDRRHCILHATEYNQGIF